MKQGWEIKKLGDVCTIERGGSPRPIDAYITDEDNGINWIKIGDATPNSKYITSTKEKIKPEGIRKSRMVYKGDFILSNSMSFGRPYILGVDGCIHDGWLVLRDNENTFDKIFLYYYLSSPFIYQEFKRLAVGGVVNNLNSELVRGVNVIVPPIAEQEKIVAELDCLSGIIEKKKQQLKELDNLAQSIFYEMFGDPVENDKGWKASPLHKVSTLINGRAYKQNELLDSGKYRVLRVGNFFTNGNYYYSDLELEDDKYCDNGDLLFAWSASFGAFIWNEDKVIYHYHIWKVLYDNDLLDIQYYRYLLNTMTAFFMKDVHGIGMVHLTKAGMEQYVLPLPPLSLQKDFASKIESIEKQKELIAQSIKETETLFNSRMDYYFN